MAGMLRKGMSWLGLGPDEDYDDYDAYDDTSYYDDEVEPVEPASRPVVRRRAMPAGDAGYEDAEVGGVRVLSPEERVEPEPERVEPARPRSVVRPVPATPSAKPHVVSPSAFNDAQEVGDWFKRNRPVIVNLQGLERDLARRLLDFSSGVAYGLGGTVERVASHVYLLTPPDVELSADDRRRIADGSLVTGQ